MHQDTALRRIAERIGGERIELRKLEDFRSVELVGIAQQPVEPGDLDIHLAQRRIGAGPRPCIGRLAVSGAAERGQQRRNAQLACIAQIAQ